MAQHNKERRYTVIVVTTTATLPKHAAPFCSLQIMFCILTVRYIYYISQCNSRVYNLVNNTSILESTSQMSHYNRRNWIILNVEASLAAPPKCQGPQLVLGWDEGEERRVRVWAVTFQYQPREGKKPSGGLGLGTDASFIIKFTWRQFLSTLSVIADWFLGSLLSLSLAVTDTHFDTIRKHGDFNAGCCWLQLV